jgi:Lar family restriction alleviation protein
VSAQMIQPCPFCGDARPHVDEVSPKEWAVLCNECGCVGPIEEHGQGPRNAVEAWNRRSALNAEAPDAG